MDKFLCFNQALIYVEQIVEFIKRVHLFNNTNNSERIYSSYQKFILYLNTLKVDRKKIINIKNHQRHL